MLARQHTPSVDNIEFFFTSLAYHKPALLGWLHDVKTAFGGAAFAGKEPNQTTRDSRTSSVCSTEVCDYAQQCSCS